MHNEIIYYCPKCKSLNIKFTCLNPTEPLMISIDNIINEQFIATAHKYSAACTDCGFKVEYTR